MLLGGDETCFLFNLSDNLRFDAIKNREGCYSSTKIIKEPSINYKNVDSFS